MPVDTARQVMEQLVKGGAVKRGWIGVEPRNLTAELADSLSLPVRSGVLITGVLQDGPAARGGVQPGDVLVKVGDKPVLATGDLFAAVAALQPGSSVALTVQRGAKQVDVKVTVGERPPASRAGR